MACLSGCRHIQSDIFLLPFSSLPNMRPKKKSLKTSERIRILPYLLYIMSVKKRKKRRSKFAFIASERSHHAFLQASPIHDGPGLEEAELVARAALFLLEPRDRWLPHQDGVDGVHGRRGRRGGAPERVARAGRLR